MARSKVSERVQKYRAGLRAAGLRPIQIWVPDVRSRAFASKAHRQSLAVASSTHGTAISMIAGILRSDAGTVTVDGLPVGLGASAAKGHIGLVPQELALYEDLSALEGRGLVRAAAA